MTCCSPTASPTRAAGSGSRRATRCTGKCAATRTACRSCSCTAVPAAAAFRITAASTIPRSGASCSTTSAARGARPRSPSSRTTRRRISSPISTGCARTSASIAGCSSAARGGRRSRSPTRRRIRSACSGSCCAASSSRRPREIEWFLYGMRYPFPEAWRAFTEFLPQDERDDLLARLLSPPHRSRSRRPPARRARLGSLRGRVLHAPSQARDPACASTTTPRRSPSRASRPTISSTRASWREDELIGNLHRIRHLPCTIVQGRYDIVCPPITADALSRAWPEAEYVIVPDAGHSVREPGITRELVAAVRRLQGRLARDGRANAA